ncbi:MAG TPA: hypothetical protein VN397_04845 [Candidatus Methylomirabilis sp.]|nr:hypothetical protein [Candidatus Methylomirabilis sp.]
MQNRIVEKFATHQDFAPWANRAIEDVARATGFVPDGEVQRRFIYDPSKTWRVRVRGTLEGRPALLRIENLKLEIDEETIRASFRRQAEGSRVRPPITYATRPFDDGKGYAWSIDEYADGRMLFDSVGVSNAAARAFMPFYRAYREAVREPFWPAPEGDITAFCAQQFDGWLTVARERDASVVQRHAPLLERLRERVLGGVRGLPPRFMHAHLTGADVRVAPDGTYVVFANHFWSWRQPGYDVAFPLWGQWMALPERRRTPSAVRDITETWLAAVRGELSDVVSADDVTTMLFNRLFGSLILDIPAQRHRESEASVAALEATCIAEAERLLG